jgi:hypothetical protein
MPWESGYLYRPTVAGFVVTAGVSSLLCFAATLDQWVGDEFDSTCDAARFIVYVAFFAFQVWGLKTYWAGGGTDAGLYELLKRFTLVLVLHLSFVVAGPLFELCQQDAALTWLGKSGRVVDCVLLFWLPVLQWQTKWLPAEERRRGVSVPVLGRDASH